MTANIVLKYLLQYFKEEEISCYIQPLLKNQMKDQLILQCYEHFIEQKQIKQITLTSPDLCLVTSFTQQSIIFIMNNYQQFSVQQLFLFLEKYYQSCFFNKKFNKFLTYRLKKNYCVPQFVIFLIDNKLKYDSILFIQQHQDMIQSVELWIKVLQQANYQNKKILKQILLTSQFCQQALLQIVSQGVFDSQRINKSLTSVILFDFASPQFTDSIINYIAQFYTKKQTINYWMLVYIFNISTKQVQYSDKVCELVSQLSIFKFTQTQQICLYLSLLKSIVINRRDKFYYYKLQDTLFSLINDVNYSHSQTIYNIILLLDSDNIDEKHQDILVNLFQLDDNLLDKFLLGNLIFKKFLSSKYIMTQIIDKLYTFTTQSQIVICKVLIYFIKLYQQESSQYLEQLMIKLNQLIVSNLDLQLLQVIFLLQNVICHINKNKNQDYQLYDQSFQQMNTYKNNKQTLLLLLFSHIQQDQKINDSDISIQENFQKDIQTLLENNIQFEKSNSFNLTNLQKILYYFKCVIDNNQDMQTFFEQTFIIVLNNICKNKNYKLHQILLRQLVNLNFYNNESILDKCVLTIFYSSPIFIQYLYKHQKFNSLINLIYKSQNYQYQLLQLENQKVVDIKSQEFKITHDVKTIFTYSICSINSFSFSFNFSGGHQYSKMDLLFFNNLFISIKINAVETIIQLDVVKDINIFGLEYFSNQNLSTVRLYANNQELIDFNLDYNPQIVNCTIKNPQYSTQQFQESEISYQQSIVNFSQQYKITSIKNNFDVFNTSNVVYMMYSDLLNYKLIDNQDFLKLSLELSINLGKKSQYKVLLRSALQKRYDLFSIFVQELQDILIIIDQNFRLGQIDKFFFLIQQIFSVVGEQLLTQEQMITLLKVAVISFRQFDDNQFLFKSYVLLQLVDQVDEIVTKYIIENIVQYINKEEDIVSLIVMQGKRNIILSQLMINQISSKFSYQNILKILEYLFQETNLDIAQQLILQVNKLLLFNDLQFDMKQDSQELLILTKYLSQTQYEQKLALLHNISTQFQLGILFTLNLKNDGHRYCYQILSNLIEEDCNALQNNHQLLLGVTYSMLTKENQYIDFSMSQILKLVSIITINNTKLLLTYYQNDKNIMVQILNSYYSNQQILYDEFALDCTILLQEINEYDDNLWEYFACKQYCFEQLVLFQKNNQVKHNKFIEKVHQFIFAFNIDEQQLLRYIVNGNMSQQSGNVRNNFVASIVYCQQKTIIKQQQEQLLLEIIGDYHLQFVFKYIYDDIQQLVDLFLDKLHVSLYMQVNINKVMNDDRNVKVKNLSKCCYKKNNNYNMICYKQICPICENKQYILQKLLHFMQQCSSEQSNQIVLSNIKTYPSKRFLLQPLLLLSKKIQYPYLRPKSEKIVSVLKLQLLGNQIFDIYIEDSLLLLVKIKQQQENDISSLLNIIQQKQEQQCVQKDEYDRTINDGLYDYGNHTLDVNFQQINLNSIRLIYEKRLCNYFYMLELVQYDSQSIQLVFNSQLDFDKFTQHSSFSKTFQEKKINVQQQIKQLMRSYKFQEISVFSFILSINYLAGRSYDDLYQYPIFPMISENRIYSEIIGKQCQDIVDKLEQKLKDNKESITEAKNSLFQTFYSHRAVASHFLFKVEPFTSIQRYLQNGVYDCYDRQFHSIQSQWDKIMTGKSLSELTPELFSTMEFYTNINNLDYNETYQFKQDGLIELDKVFYNLTKFRTQLETNQHINSWIQLIFGNQIPENTFPHFSKKQQYQSFSDPELLKSLFYGVEPDQVLEKLYIYERKVKINFQSKEGISANFQCQELPLPYFISPEIDQVLEIEEHNVKIYQLQKGAERILIWQVPTGSRAQFAKFLGPQEVLILAFNEFFLVTQNRIQPLHIDLPIKCFVQTESRRIFCLYQDCIYIYQVYDFNFRAQFVVQVEYYDQVYTFKNAWNGGLTSLFLRENRIFFQYFNSALRQVLNVELSRGCIYADFIYFYDFPRWIGTISKDGFQVLEFESLQVVYEISGAFVSFSQTGRREIGIKGPKDTIIVSM